jgi:NTE family protein
VATPKSKPKTGADVPSKASGAIKSAHVKHINVALQGGGSHGAYAWGVLDRLLAEPRIKIEAISGTSAGAMNGVLVADGLTEGGPARARAQLQTFWKDVSDNAAGSPLQRTVWDKWLSDWSLDNNPAFAAYDLMTRMVSPYQFNPMNYNSLRDLVLRHVDFKRLQSTDVLKLYVSATNVETGRVKVFQGHELTIDAIMASACLPSVFQAVEIGGVPYWDGGYVGNPTLEPFIDGCASADLLLVQINPLFRAGTPKSAIGIQDRLNEITFNASLMHELAHIETINRLIRRGHLKGSNYRELYLHRIGGGVDLSVLTASSKLNAEWDFLCHLRDLGIAATEHWLAAHYDQLGHMATMDIDQFRLHGSKSRAPVKAQ